jgi:hypothetical protein
MKKEQVTIFNLEDAFKALDEIAVPKAPRGIKANKTDLTESFKDFNRSRTDLLMEEYYDLADSADLEEAKADREAEVAKAKLAKIEKIVDLEAESEEDILPSYVGKMIIQCPQCMTLFYKEEADIVKSETDEETVNVAEICQHCGNETGYTLIGKVEGVQEEELIPEDNIEDEAQLEEPVADDELSLEPVEEVDETSDENVENVTDEENLELAPIETEEETEEKVESLQTKTSEILTEDIDNELQTKIEKHLIEIGGLKFYSKEFKRDVEIWYLGHELGEDYYGLFDPKDKANKDEILSENALEIYPDLESVFVDNDLSYKEILPQIEESLTEAVDKDLQAKLDAHNEYIKFLQEEIEKEEKALEEAKNDFIKEAIQRRLDSLYADLDSALPEEIKDTVAAEGEAPTEEAEIEIENIDTDENADAEVPVEITDASNPVETVEPIEVKEDETESKKSVKESLTESINIQDLHYEDIFDNPYTALYVARDLTYDFVNDPDDAEKLGE